ncbi:sulfatase-like hydrolase/transferase [Gilliamella mensalis]|uniref:sulfatase-like hydrolase/transferase n=1 Tax=Gilliamella mensalis TaxID=1908520 RepID=UPI000A161207|nr:sulfatase-like hydrolase/transferase [Gilliamella mensalis]
MKLHVVKKKSSLILLLVYLVFSTVLVYTYLPKSHKIHEPQVFEDPFFYLNLVTTLCFCILLHICIRSRHYFLVALSTLFLFLFFSEISYFIYYEQVISAGVLDSIIETNSYEAVSMSKQVLIITIPAFIATFIILFIFRKTVTVNFRPIIPLACYILLLFTIIVFQITHSSEKYEIKQGNYKSIAEIVRQVYPAAFGNFSYILMSYASNDIYSDANQIEKFNESVLLPPNKSDNDLVVFIMGEASLVTRYSTYGYYKQTTPFITDIFSQNGACIIQNSHSTAAFTRDSLPMTLSFTLPESYDNLFTNKSIIEMAKFNDYKTYWLASAAQAIQGSFNTKFGFIARKSDVVSFSESGDDISLSQLLEKTLQEDNSQKKFIFVHLRGSHQPYTGYDQIDKQALPDAEEYDLTVHHTDRAVKALYDTINKYSDNYTLIYTSDHGEIVNVGHGFSNGSVDQFLIPFLFISKNPKYNCQYIESFRGSTGYLSGLMNKYILSNLLGYDIDQTIIDKEKNNDRVLMPNGSTMSFLDILNKN